MGRIGLPGKEAIMEKDGMENGFILNSSPTGNTAEAGSVEDIVKLLDGYANAGVGRLKLKVVDGDGGVIAKQYHHGRCDVGSPWAKGQAFDVLEDEETKE